MGTYVYNGGTLAPLQRNAHALVEIAFDELGAFRRLSSRESPPPRAAAVLSNV